MFKKRVKLLFILCTSSLLSGCWDQEPLREARLAYSIGSDITEENKLQQTIELVKSSSGEQSSFENEIHSATGHNIRDTSDALKKNVTGNIRYFKYGVQLLGTKILKKGILPHTHQAKILLHPQNEIFRLSCNEKAYLLFWG